MHVSQQIERLIPDDCIPVTKTLRRVRPQNEHTFNSPRQCANRYLSLLPVIGLSYTLDVCPLPAEIEPCGAGPASHLSGTRRRHNDDDGYRPACG